MTMMLQYIYKFGMFQIGMGPDPGELFKVHHYEFIALLYNLLFNEYRNGIPEFVRPRRVDVFILLSSLLLGPTILSAISAYGVYMSIKCFEYLDLNEDEEDDNLLQRRDMNVIPKMYCNKYQTHENMPNRFALLPLRLLESTQSQRHDCIY
jgi:hypothetical protein